MNDQLFPRVLTQQTRYDISAQLTSNKLSNNEDKTQNREFTVQDVTEMSNMTWTF